MRKIIVLIPILFLLLVFPVVANTKKPTLEVGSQAPDIKALKWFKGQPVTSLEKGKVHVVEFGATWCKPCIGAVPVHMNRIATAYKEQVQVYSFFIKEFYGELENPENPFYLSKVAQVIQEKDDLYGSYNVAADGADRFMEKNWHNAAGLSGLPGTIIVDKDGYIAWIGTSTHFDKIDEMLELVLSDDYDLSEIIESSKQENQNSSSHEKFFIENLESAPTDIYRSGFRRSYESTKIKSGGRLDCISSYGWFNDKLPENQMKGLKQWSWVRPWELYFIAYTDTLSWNPFGRYLGNLQVWRKDFDPYAASTYGEWWPYPIIETSNPELLGNKTYLSRSNEQRYDYSLQVPKDIATAKLMQETMRLDLRKYFGYKVEIQTREMPAWILRSSKKVKKILKSKSQGERFKERFPEDGSYIYTNATSRDIRWSLLVSFGMRHFDYGRIPFEKQAPFIDETGIDFDIDYTVTRAMRNDFNLFRQYLSDNGIELKKETRPMKVIVIKDPKTTNN